MIRILIVDDSKSITMLLRAIFEDQPDMQVVGQAANGEEGVRLAASLQPDVVTMDVQMPGMDGFEATRRIMQQAPAPIIVVSSAVADEEMRVTFRALEEGAVAAVEKPPGPSHPTFSAVRRELVDTVRAMAGVKVVRRRAPKPTEYESDSNSFATQFRSAASPHSGAAECILIGSSTGGPQALAQLLAGLTPEFALPLVVVQHMSAGFIGSMADWLNATRELEFRITGDGERLLPGRVYFPPDDHHVLLRRHGVGINALLDSSAPVNGFRPSATPLFQSAAEELGGRAVGIVLTGMGEDGAKGLLAMHQAGALTMVQDPEECIVPSMPLAALQLEAVDEVLTLERMSQRLRDLGLGEAAVVQPSEVKR